VSVTANLRIVESFESLLEAAPERLLRVIERHSGRTIIRARSCDLDELERDIRVPWWTRIGVRLRWLRA
jgi:hypothetical protein